MELSHSSRSIVNTLQSSILSKNSAEALLSEIDQLTENYQLAPKERRSVISYLWRFAFENRNLEAAKKLLGADESASVADYRRLLLRTAAAADLESLRFLLFAPETATFRSELELSKAEAGDLFRLMSNSATPLGLQLLLNSELIHAALQRYKFPVSVIIQPETSTETVEFVQSSPAFRNALNFSLDALMAGMVSCRETQTELLQILLKRATETASADEIIRHPSWISVLLQDISRKGLPALTWFAKQTVHEEDLCKLANVSNSAQETPQIEEICSWLFSRAAQARSADAVQLLLRIPAFRVHSRFIRESWKVLHESSKKATEILSACVNANAVELLLSGVINQHHVADASGFASFFATAGVSPAKRLFAELLGLPEIVTLPAKSENEKKRIIEELLVDKYGKTLLDEQIRNIWRLTEPLQKQQLTFSEWFAVAPVLRQALQTGVAVTCESLLQLAEATQKQQRQRSL